MNLHLYYCPGTCSFVPHVALELVKESSGQNFDGTVINLKNGEHLKPEYKAINPRGQVPALIVDGKLITQVIAITGFLHDSFPKAQIFPTDPMAKAQAVSILAWMNNTVHPTFTRVFRSERFGDEAGKAGVKAMALEAFKGYLAEIVGDNYADMNERYYGNGDCKGSGADHGTHVAGIIAATRKNNIGMDGVADNVRIMSVRCVPDGDERDKDVANAIRYAVDNGEEYNELVAAKEEFNY